MSIIRPFRALRPHPDLAKQVSCVPYDVPYDSEVREYIANNQVSFLRVTRPEAEFAVGEKPSRDAVLEKAKTNFEAFIEKGVLNADTEPSVYIYRIEIDGHRQTGIVACCSLDEYSTGAIKKHEKTRPDKVEDRTDHMVKLRAQTGLILLAFRGTDALDNLIKEETALAPAYQSECEIDGTQTVWRATRSDAIVNAFKDVSALYVADGHHRIESALLASKRLEEASGDHSPEAEHRFVMAGIFPAADLKILPYNRAVKDLNGLSSSDLLERLRAGFHIEKGSASHPANSGEFCMYLEGDWYLLRSALEWVQQPDPIESLDVSLLQNGVLRPILGIDDPRTSERITFVGGRRGTTELERLVDSGEAAVAFSMFPTSMEDLFSVSDMGEIMPPKSTWFEPKLKDGLFVHSI